MNRQMAYRRANKLRWVVVDVLDDDVQYSSGLLERRALISGDQN